MQLPSSRNRNTRRPPHPLSHTNFGRTTLVLHFSLLTNLLSHRKYVSHCLLFFLTPRRNGRLDATPLGQCGFDLLDNRLRLPAGLGDLPLYPEEDEWYSVLGLWKGTADNPDDVNQDDPEANPDVPIPPVNPPRNARPDPALIYCEYPKCSGNRLVIPLHLLPYSILICTLPPQRPSLPRSRSTHLPSSWLLLARHLQDQASPHQTLPI